MINHDYFQSNKILFYILMITIFNLFAFNIYAVNKGAFGATCIKVDGFPNGDYLKNNSIFNYLYQYFDMKNIDDQRGVKNACATIKIPKDQKGEIIFYVQSGRKVNKDCFASQDSNGNQTYFCQKTMTIGTSGDTISNIAIHSTELRNNPLLKNVIISAEQMGNAACLMIETSRGKTPFLCTSLLDNDKDDKFLDLKPLNVCSNINSSCYDSAKKSQSLFNFSGVTVHCVKEALDKTFFYKKDCVQNDPSLAFTMLRGFPDFQKYMRQIVFAALIIYVMVYGFKLALNVDYASLNQIALFVMKLILVTYFSVGIVPIGQRGHADAEPQNGVKEYVIDFALAATSTFADIVFSSAGNAIPKNGGVGLCEFDMKNYNQGFKNFHLWDSIDCRIAYYLGMDLIYGEGKLWDDGHITTSGDVIYDKPSIAVKDIDTNSGSDGMSKDEIEGLNLAGNLKFFNVMFGLLMGGQILVVLAGIMFGVFLISVLLYFLTLYLVCMITIYALAYIAPIFVPMALFQQTKEYFNSWLRILLSCTIQPAVIGGFIALLLTIYDTAIYGNCAFERANYAKLTINTQDDPIHHDKASIFKLKMPENDGINLPLHDPKTNVTNCSHSLGYKLYQYYNGYGWQKTDLIIFQILSIKDSLDMASSLFYVLLFTFLFYFFMQSMSEFASQLTNGPNMSAVTASPTMVVDKVISAAKKAQEVAKAAQNLKKGGASSSKQQSSQGTKARGSISDSLDAKGGS